MAEGGGLENRWPKRSVGSNPTLSALFNERRIIIKHRDMVLTDSDGNKFIRRYFNDNEYKDYPMSINNKIILIDTEDEDDDFLDVQER